MNRQREFYYYAEKVTKRTGVSLRDMQSRNRKREWVEARQCLMYILRYKMKMTLTAIAKLMRRDHSTVYHSLLVIGDLKITTNRFFWMDHVKLYTSYNIMPQKNLYLCERCGSSNDNHYAVHLGQAQADCAPTCHA